jgi:hypothetical protein
MVFSGREISRNMPPGHSNAIFLSDANAIDVENYKDAFLSANKQNAFIFWNHPCWSRQQPDTIVWFNEHTWLLENNLVHGIEVVNGPYYCPEAHRWCLEKDLAFIANSDIHKPIGMDYAFYEGKHRPLTLAFVTEKTPQALKEALFAKRTLIVHDYNIIGNKDIMNSFVNACVSITATEKVTKNAVQITFYNKSSIPFLLVPQEIEGAKMIFPGILNLKEGETIFIIEFLQENIPNTIDFKFIIENAWIEPNTGLPFTFYNVPIK